MDAGAATVLEIFEKKHRLEVPLFQRQYVWNEEHQWAPLWEDNVQKLEAYGKQSPQWLLESRTKSGP